MLISKIVFSIISRAYRVRGSASVLLQFYSQPRAATPSQSFPNYCSTASQTTDAYALCCQAEAEAAAKTESKAAAEAADFSR